MTTSPKHTLTDGALRVEVYEPRHPSTKWLVVATLGGARQASAKREDEGAALVAARSMVRRINWRDEW